MNKKRLLLAGMLLAAGAAGLGSHPALATSLEPRNLAELVRSSNQIVVGTVEEVSGGHQGNLPYIEVTITVAESIRGESGGTLTFRQLGMPAGDQVVDGRRVLGLMPAFPVYTAGEEVVLFLGPVTPSGFRATVGLQQGKFNVFAGGVQNGLGNVGLFKNVAVPESVTLTDSMSAVLGTDQGAVNTNAFLETVRRAVSEEWWKQSSGPSRPARQRLDNPAEQRDTPGRQGLGEIQLRGEGK